MSWESSNSSFPILILSAVYHLLLILSLPPSLSLPLSPIFMSLSHPFSPISSLSLPLSCLPPIYVFPPLTYLPLSFPSLSLSLLYLPLSLLFSPLSSLPPLSIPSFPYLSTPFSLPHSLPRSVIQFIIFAL